MSAAPKRTPFRTVIFDCDSTLSAIEGIEELARAHRLEVSRLTDLAMSGALPLEEVYAKRMELIRPSQAEVARIGAMYVERIVPGVEEVVRTLRAESIDIRILSGGLAPAVRVLARHLGIPDKHVAAVEISFGADGSYTGFEADSWLARSGGKRRWVEEQGDRLQRPVLLVGDGATDLEARPAVAAFAAFAGVVSRPEVVRHADIVIAGPSMTELLPFIRRGV